MSIKESVERLQRMCRGCGMLSDRQRVEGSEFCVWCLAHGHGDEVNDSKLPDEGEEENEDGNGQDS